MRIKKVLSLAVVLAMVLTVVPMFGLTASAAVESPVKTALGGTEIYSVDDAASSFESAWDTSNSANASFSMEGGIIKLTKLSDRGDGKAMTASITTSGYAKDENKFYVAWKWDCGSSNGELYADIRLLDNDDKPIVLFTVDQESNNADPVSLAGLYEKGTEVAIVVTNLSDSHVVEYFVNGEYLTSTTVMGTVNGFKKIETGGGDYSNKNNYIGFDDFTIGKITESNVNSVKAAIQSLDLGAVAVDKVTLPTTFSDGITSTDVTWSADPEEIVNVKTGEVTHPKDSTAPIEVTFTASANYSDTPLTSKKTVTILPASYEGGYYVDGDKKYPVQGANLITNGSFTDNYNNWGARNPDASDAPKFDESRWLLHKSNDANYVEYSTTLSGSSDNTIAGYWDITDNPATKYLLTYYTYNKKYAADGGGRMQAATLTKNRSKQDDNVRAAGGHSSWPTNDGHSPRDIAVEEGWTRKSYILDKEKVGDSEKIYATYQTAHGGKGFRLTGFELYALGEPETATVTTVKDQFENTLYTGKVFKGETEKAEIAERTYYNEGKIYKVAKQTVDIPQNDPNQTIEAEVAQEYAATSDGYIDGGDNNTFKESDESNYVFAAVNGNSKRDKDADGNKTYTVNWSGHEMITITARAALFTFKKPTEIPDGKVVLLRAYVAYANNQVVSQNQKDTVRLFTAPYSGGTSGTTAESVVTGLKDEIWSDKFIGSASSIGGNWRECNTWIAFDVTNAIKSAGDTVTFAVATARAGAYLADTENAVFGGKFEGKVAYLEVVDGVKVTVNGAAENALITKNGSKVATAADGTATFYALEGDTVRVYKGEANSAGLAAVKVEGGTVADNTVTTVGAENTTITVVTAPTTAPDASLGWDDNSGAFTANFTPAAADNGNVTGFDVKVVGDSATSDVTLTADNTGIAVPTDKTNAILEVAAKNIAGAGPTVRESIYSLVMKAVKNFAEENSDSTIVTDQLVKVNDVLKDGGLYITNKDGQYSLTEEVNGVLEIAQPTDGTSVTITILENAARAGLKFVADGLPDSEGNTVEFFSETKVTVDVSNIETQEAEILSLDAVYLEFVPSEITETEADGASDEVEFIEEL